MTTSHFYQHFNHSRPLIQSFASELTKDFDMARFLYLEVTHQAIKHKTHLKPDTLEEWLINMMIKTYNKLTQKEVNILMQNGDKPAFL